MHGHKFSKIDEIYESLIQQSQPAPHYRETAEHRREVGDIKSNQTERSQITHYGMILNRKTTY